MKRLVLILAVIALVMPHPAFTQQTYDFKVIGHGALGDQLGLPMAVCALKDGSVATFDSSTTSVSVFDSSNKLTKKFRIAASSLNADLDLSSLSTGNFISPISFDANESGSFFILNKNAVLKIDDKGLSSPFINFASMAPEVKKPVVMHIHGDNFYVLDQSLGVLVFDSTGKYMQTIGEIGTGSGKFSNPVNFWVGFDGSVVVLDFFPIMQSEEGPTTELLVSMFDSKGKLIREFGPQTTDPFGGDYQLLMPWVGAMTRTKLFLVDLSFTKDFTITWVIKQFNLNGDYEKSWPIIEDEKLDKSEIIRDLISSMDAGDDEKIYFSMPFHGKIYNDPSLFIPIGTSANNECLKMTCSAITAPSGVTYALDMYPAVLHVYDSDGKQIKQVPIVDKFMNLPGLDFSIATDLAYTKGEIVVSTAYSIVRLDEKTLEPKDSIDLGFDTSNLDIISSISSKEGIFCALDAKGKVTVSSTGAPITFDATKDMGSSNLTDICIDRDGNINILCPQTKKVGIFTASGSFLKSLDVGVDDALPTSIACLPTGEMAVLDSSHGVIRVLAATGAVFGTAGKLEMLQTLQTVDDYQKSPGSFYLPSHITCNQDSIITVVDYGNCRIQTVKSSTPPPPEKKPAKLVLSKAVADFGTVYYENDGITQTFEISNSGDVELAGTIKSTSSFVKINPKLITADTKTVTITFVPDKTLVWKKFSDTITIDTNGGNATVRLSANVVGKVIKMSIGNTVFTVITDKTEDYQSSRAPEIVGGRTYVPLRATGDVFKAEVRWDQATKKVTYKLDDKTIELWIGKNTANVNGQSVPLTNPPILLNNSTYVPIRFVSEQLGAKVEWDATTKTATITYPAP